MATTINKGVEGTEVDIVEDVGGNMVDTSSRELRKAVVDVNGEEGVHVVEDSEAGEVEDASGTKADTLTTDIADPI